MKLKHVALVYGTAILIAFIGLASANSIGLNIALGDGMVGNGSTTTPLNVATPLPAGHMPAYSGDVTSAAGTGVNAFRSFAADSVLGRAAGTSGIPTEITASADSQVLQRAAGVLTWATLPAASLPAFSGDVTTSAGSSVTSFRTFAGDSVLGRSASSSGIPTELTATADNQVLSRSGGTVAFNEAGLTSPTFGIFCDGSDGALVFDGSTTILGFAPSSNVYTVTREVCATNMTINNGVTVVMANTDTVVTNTAGTQAFRLFATGTCTINGKIRNNGAPGQTAPNAGAGGAGQLGTSTQNGHAGGTGGGAGAGSNGTSSATNLTHTTVAAVSGGAGTGPNGGTGGGGGAGGHGSAGNGGNGGALTAFAAANGTPRDFFALTRGVYLGTATQSNYSGAGGGGGGGATSQSGGGGGGGGGLVDLFCRNIAGSGSIEAKGGDGGAAQAAGNGGGGGGGGGGTIVVVHAQGTIVTTNVSGGAAGAHVGTGSDGGAGGAGAVFDLKN